MNLIEELLKQFAEKSGQNKPLLPGQPAGGTPPFVPPMQNSATPTPPQQAPTSNGWAGDFAGEKRPPPPLQEVKPNVTGKHLQDIKPQGVMHLRDIETPDRGDPKAMAKTPFHKDNDRMAMMFSALSDGFGGMTMSGKSGMAAINKANYASGMEGVKNNKSMNYLIQHNPALAQKLLKIAPKDREQFMKLSMQSSFTGTEESAFAEKVRMLEATGVPREQAVSQVLSGSGTNINMNMGGAAKPFETKLGESAADWVSGRNVASRGNRREANRVIADLEESIKRGEAVTGSFASYFPDSVRNVIDTEGLDMQQSVERIVQQSLKETLGAQFAQKEAEQLFARTWNPKASPEVNLRRTKRLLGELDAYAANMDHISNGLIQGDGQILKYLQENPLDSGSLFGSSIYDIEYEEPYDAGTPAQKPAEVSQSDWDLLNDEERELFR